MERFYAFLTFVHISFILVSSEDSIVVFGVKSPWLWQSLLDSTTSYPLMWISVKWLSSPSLIAVVILKTVSPSSPSFPEITSGSVCLHTVIKVTYLTFGTTHTRSSQDVKHYFACFRPEWCISTIYHAWDTPFWLGTLDLCGISGTRLTRLEHHPLTLSSHTCLSQVISRIITMAALTHHVPQAAQHFSFASLQTSFDACPASWALWTRRPPWEWWIWGSIPAYTLGIFLGWVIPVTSKLALQWQPCQVPGIIGSALGLVGWMSAYCDWVR